MGALARQRFTKPGVIAIAPQALSLDFALFVAPDESYTLGANGVATIAVRGPLAYSDSWFQCYSSIVASARAAFADPAATTVVLDVDSCGGECRGCWTASATLRQLADESGKPYFALVTGDACSAAYALACSADKVVLSSPDAQVGSIGTLLARLDATGADTQAGLQVVYLSSAPEKLYGDAHAPVTAAELASYATIVQQDAQKFFELVAARRGIPVASVQAMRAACFYGADAIAAGLADQIAESIDEVVPVRALENQEDTTPMSFADLITALEEVATGDSADAATAQRMLAAFEPPKDDEDKPADDAPADDDDDEEKKDKAEATGASVSARTAGELASQIQALQTKVDSLLAERNTESREAYMAKHNVGVELRAVLANKPFSEVKAIVDAVVAKKAKPAGALATVRTKAQHAETDERVLSGAEAADLDRVMGINTAVKPVITQRDGIQTFKHARKA